MSMILICMLSWPMSQGAVVRGCEWEIRYEMRGPED